MADEGTTTATGQPDATAPVATANGTDSGAGQPEATAATTQSSGTQAASGEDTFFDPKDLDPELVPAYKNMQKAFGKKMEEIKGHRQKIDAFDQFQKDPLTTIQTIASRMGYSLTRADTAAIASGSQPPSQTSWEPQTWDEVMARAKEEVLKELNPVFSELQAVKKSNMEKMLDDAAPDWREYEDAMVGNLKKHPSLANDPVMLYRMSVPSDVLETRATQAALKKLQAKADSSKVGGTSTTKPTIGALPNKSVSFSEAVEIAKRNLADRGIRAPQ